MAEARASKRKILTSKEIQLLLKGLEQNFGGTWGYAGSYARGKQKISSDLDIVYKDVDLNYNNYFDIVKFIEDAITIRFDIIDLEASRLDDEEMDRKSAEIGLPVNDTSPYKNIIKDVIWIG